MTANRVCGLLRIFLLLLAWAGSTGLQADDSVGEVIGGTVSSFADRINSLFDTVEQGGAASGVEAPKSIAVLPALGEGDEQTRADIRIAVHNNLSAKPFELLKPYQVDRGLAVLEQRSGSADIASLDPQTVAEALNVDGLVYVRVDEFEKLYAAAYAHFKIGMSLSLYDRQRNTAVWEHSESVIEREGGVSLNPLGMIATAITSTQALTDGVRLILIDSLARKTTASIPLPSGDLIERPQIETAFSNAADGPFSAGREIQVALTGEPGLIGSFDLLPLQRNLELQEIEKGRYLGRYVVSPRDGEQALSAVLRLRHPRSRADLDWTVPGKLEIDTIAPQALHDLRAAPAEQGVRLSWRYPELTGREVFQVSRSDPDSGVFSRLGEVAVTEYIDREAVPGSVYFYRVQPVDAAGNSGPMASQRIVAIKPGPTRIERSLVEDMTLHAAGSPYIVDGRLNVPRGVTLSAQPGTIIEFTEGSSLNVLGQLNFVGDDSASIVVKGPFWRIGLENTGKVASLFEYVRLTGAKGTVKADNSALVLAHCQVVGMQSALLLRANSSADIRDCLFRGNQAAVTAHTSHVQLNDTAFVDNQVGISLADSSRLAVQGLRMSGNRLHLRTQQPLTIAGHYFQEDSYPVLLAHVEGPVSFTWKEQVHGENAFSKWLLGRTGRMMVAAGQGNWSSVADDAVDIYKSTRLDHVRDLERMARVFAGTPGPGPTGEDIKRITDTYLQNPGRYTPWVQHVRMPFRKDYRESDYLLKQDALGRAYSDFRANKGLGQGLGQDDDADDFDAAIVDSAMLHKARSGFYLEGWFVHLLHRDRLAKSFSADTGESGDKVVGIVNPHAHLLSLDRFLDGAGFRLVPLGKGPMTRGVLERAGELGVQAVLLVEASFSSTPSRLSQNLNIAAANLQLKILDPASGAQLDGLSGRYSEPSFSEKGDQGKLLSEAFERSRDDLVDALHYVLSR